MCFRVSGLLIWKIGCALMALGTEFGKLGVFCGAMVPNLENWLRSGVHWCLIWKVECALKCLVGEFEKLSVR